MNQNNVKKTIYYHIDKSGAVKKSLSEKIDGVTYLICEPSVQFNAFLNAFMTTEYFQLALNKIDTELYEKVSVFFKTRNIEIAEEIITCLSSVISPETEKNISRLLREIIFEKIRIEKFPNKPSRLNCTYLIEDGVDIQNWTLYLNFKIDKVYNFEIKNYINKQIILPNGNELIESIHHADAKLLEIGVDDCSKVTVNATQYWNGTMTNNPLVEILFYGLLKLIEEN